MHLKKGNPDDALKEYRIVLCSRLDESTLGVMSLSAVGAGRIFLERKQLDSAEKYCSFAMQLESPFADGLYSDISKAGKTAHQKIPPKEKLMEMYHSASFERNYPAPTMVLQTTRGLLDLQASHDTALFLFFSTSSCSVCRKYIPEIVKELGKSPNRAYKAVVVTEEKPDEVKTRYGVSVSSAATSASLQYAFMARAFPTVYVVKNGRIRYKSEGLGDHSAPGFRYMLERQLK
jgi:hypothetical protein